MRALFKVFSSRMELLRFLRFCAVGASGVLVNMAIFAVCLEVFMADMPDGPRNILATSAAVTLSILTNFLLNDAWTWKDRRQGSMGARLLKYYVVAGIAGLLQVGIQYLLSVQLTLDGYLSNMAGIAAGVALNFFINNLWTFRAEQNSQEDDGDADGLHRVEARMRQVDGSAAP